jgi:HD-like signal output (HDOD) protein
MAATGIAVSEATPFDQEAFAFVKMLADELSRGHIELPSFPDTAIRVRQVLADEEVSVDKVRQIVSTEPALAARIMQMANSAALNRLGKSVLDLRSAIARIGFNLVRSAALVFAMAQMRRANDLVAVKELLEAHWRRSCEVAAFAHVVARHLTTVNADTALLAGLLHGVGRLYIISRSVKHPKLFADAAAFAAIERDWSENITAALLTNWGLDGEIRSAIRDHLDFGREHAAAPDLTDILTIASLLASLHAYPDQLELNLQNVKAAERLKLNRPVLEKLLADAADELVSVRTALSG